MDILDSLPDIHHVPVDLVPRVDAFKPLGPPPDRPRQQLLRSGKSTHTGPPFGWRGHEKLPLPCLSCPPRPFFAPQADLKSSNDSLDYGLLGTECSTNLGTCAGVESGSTRPFQSLMESGWKDCGMKLELDGSGVQKRGRLQGLDMSRQLPLFHEASLPGPAFKCAPLQLEVGEDAADGKDYSRFKANNRTMPIKVDTCCKLTGHDMHLICEKAALVCKNLKTASYVIRGEPYKGGPRLGQIASTWFKKLAQSDIYNGELQKLLHPSKRGVKPATANPIPPTSFGGSFDSHAFSLLYPVLQDQEDHCVQERFQGPADIFPVELGSLRVPSPDFGATASRQQYPDALAADKPEEKEVEIVAYIRSPTQPKIKDKPAASSLQTFAEGQGVPRESEGTQAVSSCESKHLSTGQDWSETCIHGFEEGCPGKFCPISSNVQPNLLPMTSHDKPIHFDVGDLAQQGNNEEFQQFLLDFIRSPSPSPFLQRQVDLPMDMPSLESMLDAFSNKCKDSGPSKLASVQAGQTKCQSLSTSPPCRKDDQINLPLPALATCCGVHIVGPETAMNITMLPHSTIGVSSPLKVVCTGTNAPEDPKMDIPICSEAGVVEDTSSFGIALPELIAPSIFKTLSPFLGPHSSSYMDRYRGPDNDSNMVSAHPWNDCMKHKAASGFMAAEGRRDVKAFKEGSEGDWKAERNVEEDMLPCKLRPTFAEGIQRLLSKDMLRSVYHLPINEAAAQLHVGVTVLKKFCRQQCVGRWPYRKLQSVDKLIRSVDEQSEQDPAGADYVIRELGILKQEIYSNPEVKLDNRIKRLRQANFKAQYKQRQAIDGNSVARKHLSCSGILDQLGVGEVLDAKGEAADTLLMGAPMGIMSNTDLI